MRTFESSLVLQHHQAPRAKMGTILVVDDEKMIRTLLASILCEEGFTVITAASGPQAIAAFRSQNGAIDLLISDVSMPGMDGPSIAAEILALEPKLPVLFVSGCCDDEQGLKCRGFEFLSKPFSAPALLEKVRSLLAASESLV
jgi:two-component system cell cycle sensor histidine kinase/response regulator CckA